MHLVNHWAQKFSIALTIYVTVNLFSRHLSIYINIATKSKQLE